MPSTIRVTVVRLLGLVHPIILVVWNENRVSEANGRRLVNKEHVAGIRP